MGALADSDNALSQHTIQGWVDRLRGIRAALEAKGMSEMKELLASVAREYVKPDSNTNQAFFNYLLEILERRLLPLLEAGQAIRDEYLKFTPATTILNWDRALAAAKERQPMTDERKEWQQPKIGPRTVNGYDGQTYILGTTTGAQPEPRGSEALRVYETALRSIAANSCCDRCQEAALVAKAALAAATAERTPQNPLDVAYNAIWKLWDKDPENTELGMALQAIQRIGQPPAERTPQIGQVVRIIAELNTTGKDLDSMGYGLLAVRVKRLASELSDLADRQPAPPQPEEKK
jgi:hypothetical protein